MSEPPRPFTLAPGDGETLPTPAGGHVTFKVRRRDSSGRVSVLQFEVPADAGPRRHVHEEADECIYVLHGRLRLQLGDETHDARTGSCVFIPRGTPHHFRNLGRDPASLLAVYTPSSGIERFIEDFAAGESRA